MNKLTKTTAFWIITVWTPKDTENACSTFLRKVATYLPNNTESHPKRHYTYNCPQLEQNNRTAE